MKSRMRQNQEIKETVEANLNKKGRSKSRRTQQHKTIEDYNGGATADNRYGKANLSALMNYSSLNPNHHNISAISNNDDHQYAKQQLMDTFTK